MAKRLQDLIRSQRWSIDEFLELDDGTDTRFELLRGELVAMAPPASHHGRLVMRLGLQLGPQLRRPCEPVAEAGIRPRGDEETFYVADLVVSCAPIFPETRYATDPILVAEIRSPSTEGHDLVEKLVAYQGITSVMDILLIDARSPRIDHFTREGEGWRQLTHLGKGTVHLTGIPATIDLASLYEGLFAPESQ